MDMPKNIKYTKEKSSKHVGIEMGAVAQHVNDTSKVLAKPQNAAELRALVSKKPAFGMKLVDQYKQGR